MTQINGNKACLLQHLINAGGINETELFVLSQPWIGFGKVPVPARVRRSLRFKYVMFVRRTPDHDHFSRDPTHLAHRWQPQWHWDVLENIKRYDGVKRFVGQRKLAGICDNEVLRLRLCFYIAVKNTASGQELPQQALTVRAHLENARITINKR